MRVCMHKCVCVLLGYQIIDIVTMEFLLFIGQRHFYITALHENQLLTSLHNIIL